MINQIELALTALRKNNLLILNLTNQVTMDFMANSLLALGAAPLMSIYENELFELINIADAININIGTLHEKSIASFFSAIGYAKQLNKPVILDPVGCGASLVRTTISRQLISQVDIICGNASEIMALHHDNVESHGVESLNSTEHAKETAVTYAKQYANTVVVSGEMDFITDGNSIHCFNYGSKLMSLVTGMGCTLSAVIAAFKTVILDAFDAAKIATLYFGLCGHLAEKKAHTPGTFKTAFIDALYLADFDKMRQIYVR